MMELPDWVSAYVGLPFKEGGRHRDGLDCYGLLRLVINERFAVRRIRKRLHLTQKDAGRLIGGGPNAFQKCESGDVVVSHAVMSALLLLDRDPSGLSVLKQRVNRKEAA